MDKFFTLTAVAAPLAIDNCDTDQIMPKQFLRGIDKSGLNKGTFFNLRCYPDGTPKPQCIFNQPGFESASILVAGPNFGCGSSREHAVWGLMQFGIRAVIAPGFGEIFYSNCFNNGLLAARVSPDTLESIMADISEKTPTSLTVDLTDQTIRSSQHCWHFDIAPRHRTMLLEGLDMVGASLKDIELIKAFQANHEARFPWMAKLAAQAKRHRSPS